MSYPSHNGNGEPLHPRMALWDALLARRFLRKLTPAQTKVLAAFISHVNKSAEAHPGVERLSDQTGLAVRSVHRTMAELTSLGLLVTVSRGGGFRKMTVRRVCIPETLTVRTVTPPRSNNPDRGAVNTLTPPSPASIRNNVGNRKRLGEHDAAARTNAYSRRKTGGRAVLGVSDVSDLAERLVLTIGVDDWHG